MENKKFYLVMMVQQDTDGDAESGICEPVYYEVPQIADTEEQAMLQADGEEFNDWVSPQEEFQGMSYKALGFSRFWATSAREIEEKEYLEHIKERDEHVVAVVANIANNC